MPQSFSFPSRGALSFFQNGRLLALAGVLALGSIPLHAESPLEPSTSRQSFLERAMGRGKAKGHATPAAKDAQQASSKARVEDFGAKGDGATDDTGAIQAAIQSCFEKHIKVLSFTAGKSYLLTADGSQNTLVLYGRDLTLEGNGATLVKASAKGGYWGDVLDICGLINDHIYPGIGKYQGAGASAENITVKDLTIDHRTQTKFMNSIGINKSTNVSLINVTSLNAPQTAFAVVSDSADKPVSHITLQGCKAVNSGYHAYRVSLQGNADTLNVVMDHCSSQGVRNPEAQKEIQGLRAHVWYRAADRGPGVGLKISHCSFDDSGAIVTTQGAKGLTVEDSDLQGGMVLKGGRKGDAGFVERGNRMNPSRPLQDLRAGGR